MPGGGSHAPQDPVACAQVDEAAPRQKQEQGTGHDLPGPGRNPDLAQVGTVVLEPAQPLQLAGFQDLPQSQPVRRALAKFLVPEHFLEETTFGSSGVRSNEGVEGPFPFPAQLDQALRTELPQLGGKTALAPPQDALELVHGQLRLGQKPEDPDATGVGEDFQETREIPFHHHQ